MNLNYHTVGQVEICDNPTADYFNQHFGYPAKPALIKNVASKWEALKKWTPEYFIINYPSLLLRVTRTDQSAKKRMTIKDYFKYMNSCFEDNPYYLSNWIFENECPELLADYQVPDYLQSWTRVLDKEKQPRWRWLFIGAAHSGTKMHVDIMDTSAWNVVVSGRKHWLFFPKTQYQNVYDGSVDAFNPNFEHFPLLSEATPFYCVQEPGEIVYTPSGWWHQVYNEKAGISLTENFINETNFKDVEQYLEKFNRTDELAQLQSVKTHFSPII